MNFTALPHYATMGNRKSSPTDPYLERYAIEIELMKKSIQVSAEASSKDFLETNGSHAVKAKCVVADLTFITITSCYADTQMLKQILSLLNKKYNPTDRLETILLVNELVDCVVQITEKSFPLSEDSPLRIGFSKLLARDTSDIITSTKHEKLAAAIAIAF